MEACWSQNPGQALTWGFAGYAMAAAGRCTEYAWAEPLDPVREEWAVVTDARAVREYLVAEAD